MFNHILVGLDGSPGSLRAMEAAATMAAEDRATLHALTVIDRDPRFAATVGEVDEEHMAHRAYAQQVQEQARHIAAKHSVTVETLTAYGHAAQTLADRTRSGNYDLLVLGASGHSGVWGQFLGSTTDKVSRHAGCSVLIVR